MIKLVVFLVTVVTVVIVVVAVVIIAVIVVVVSPTLFSKRKISSSNSVALMDKVTVQSKL